MISKKICGRCGGSGRISQPVTKSVPKTETVYENGRPRTRTVYRTETTIETRVCPVCGGFGKI